jgi:hypothetical protein
MLAIKEKFSSGMKDGQKAKDDLKLVKAAAHSRFESGRPTPKYPRVLMPEQPKGFLKARRYDFF